MLCFQSRIKDSAGQKECKKGSQHAVKKMNLLTYLRTHSRVNILRHRFCSRLCTETSHLSPNPSKTQNPGKAAEKREKQGIFLPPSIHYNEHKND